jgi:hypothetical protein
MTLQGKGGSHLVVRVVLPQRGARVVRAAAATEQVFPL